MFRYAVMSLHSTCRDHYSVLLCTRSVNRGLEKEVTYRTSSVRSHLVEWRLLGMHHACLEEQTNNKSEA